MGNDVFRPNKSKEIYSYLFKNNKKSFSFSVGVEQNKSYLFNVNVIRRPKIKSFNLHAYYPKYTKLKDEVFTNLSDVDVPVGTLLKWKVKVFSDEYLTFKKDSTLSDFKKSNDIFYYTDSVYENFDYTILLSNSQLKNFQNLDYSIKVIKDKFPSIDVAQLEYDKFNIGSYSYHLQLKDDYGLTNVGYKIFDTDKILKVYSKHLSSVKTLNLNLDVDTKELNLTKNAFIKFFVVDNDAVQG